MKKYISLIKCSLLNQLQYRVNFILSLIGILIPFVINFVFWKAVYSNSPDTVLYGYTYQQMIQYVIATNLIGLITNINFANSVSADIHSGYLSTLLIKPFHYIPYKMLNQLGGSFLQIGAFIIVSAVLFYFWGVDGITALQFYLAVILGFMVNNFLYYCIAVTSFWFTETGYLFWALQELFRIISGAIFPLTVLGTGFGIVSKFLPFQYIVYFPINIISKRVELNEYILGIGVQILWVFLLWGIAHFFWEKGLRKYIATGG